MTQGAPKKNDVAQNFSGAIFFCNSIFAPSYLSDRHSEQQLKKTFKRGYLCLYIYVYHIQSIITPQFCQHGLLYLCIFTHIG